MGESGKGVQGTGQETIINLHGVFDISHKRSNSGSADETLAHMAASIPGTEEASVIREHGGERRMRHEIRGFKTTSTQHLCAQTRGGAHFLPTSRLTSHGQSVFLRASPAKRAPPAAVHIGPTLH